jgi:general stress protein YciG
MLMGMRKIPTAAEMGRKGGKTRAQNLTPKRMREIAAMGGKASAGKPKKRKKKKGK